MNLLGPCIANDVEAIHSGGNISARKIPDLVLLALFRDIFDRRLAIDPAQQQELRETGTVTLPSEYDPAGYTYRLSLFEDGKQHLVMRRSIPLDCPVRLLHGMNDVSVPWQTSLTLAERLASRDVVLTLIKDGDHRLSRETDLERLGRTLDELLGTVR